MKYNFDSYTSRFNLRAVKLMEFEKDHNVKGALPMWIADMDFDVCDRIVERLKKRIEVPFYGYTLGYPDTKKLLSKWYEKRHRVKVNEDAFLFSTGVNYSYSLIIDLLVKEDEKVILNSPIYPPFYHQPENLGREVVYCPMLEEGDTYRFDFDLFEKLLKEDKKIRLFNLCNPYNPLGLCFSLEDLNRIGEICHRYGVYLNSDEIHSDIIMPGNEFNTALLMNEEYKDKLITAGSVTKTFNLAGLKVSYMVIENEELRKKASDRMHVLGLDDISLIGYEAIEAALSEGEEWLDQCNEYILDNFRYMKEYVDKYLPEAKFRIPEATYLGWLDLRAYDLPEDFIDRLIKEAKVQFNPGTAFLADYRFLRINVACPRKQVMKALENLTRWLRDNKYL